MKCDPPSRFAESSIASDAVANHPATERLAEIFADAERLAKNLRGFLADHQPKCRCKCCAFIRKAEDGFGSQLRDQLITSMTVLELMVDLSLGFRPTTADELREMRADLLSRKDGGK
jgi:hypothetical protein